MNKPVDTASKRSSQPISICTQATFVAGGGPETPSYQVEFPTRQLQKDFVHRWGVWPAYAYDESVGCRMQTDLPGLVPDRTTPLRLWISPGGVKRAERILWEMGLKPDVDWAPKRLGTSPDMEVLPILQKVNPQLMEQVADSRRGLIEIERDGERLNFAHAILRLHPKARCQILVRSKNVGERVVQQLKNCGIDAGFVRSPKSVRAPSFVTVSCAANTNAYNFDLLIFWDAARVTLRDCQLEMYLTVGHRVFGFVDNVWAKSADSVNKVLIESLIGPMLTPLTAPTTSIRHGLVLVPLKCRQRVARDADGLERKRRLVWNNRPRNQAIAKVANDLIANVGSTSKQVEAVRKHLGRQTAQCVVLVETLEHAQQLSGALADWAVVTYSPDAVEEIRETGGLHGRAIMHSPKMIMTTSAANAIYSGSAKCHHNVAVWAGGGPQASSCEILKDIPVIVDVKDKGEQLLSREAGSRVKSYQR